MIDAIHSLDTFRTIIEYREEVCVELAKEHDETLTKLNETKLDAQLFENQD